MAWRSGCVRSECQHVKSVNSLALACFQVAKFLEAVFCVTSIAWQTSDGQACAVVFARGMYWESLQCGP